MDKALIDKLIRINEDEATYLTELERDVKKSPTIRGIRVHKWQRDITLRIHSKFIPFPEHSHDFVEVMTVVSGSITHHIGGETVTLGEGDVLMMNKHTVHSIDSTKENDIGINIIISDAFLSVVAPELDDTVFCGFVKENANPGGAPAYLHFSTGESKQAKNLIENLIIELTDEHSDRRILTETVSLLLRHLSLGRETLLRGGAAYGKKEARKIEISAYVSANYRRGTLGELADRTYLSPPYLSKAVKELFGKSFSELMVDEKMKRAKELLCKTAMPVESIIRAVGYESESYFHREFKRRFDTTPLAMRKDAKNKIDP